MMFRHKDKSPECQYCGSGINHNGEGHHPYCAAATGMATTDKFNPMRLRSESAVYPAWLQLVTPCHCGGTAYIEEGGLDEVWTCVRCMTKWRPEDVPL